MQRGQPCVQERCIAPRRHPRLFWPLAVPRARQSMKSIRPPQLCWLCTRSQEREIRKMGARKKAEERVIKHTAACLSRRTEHWDTALSIVDSTYQRSRAHVQSGWNSRDPPSSSHVRLYTRPNSAPWTPAICAAPAMIRHPTCHTIRKCHTGTRKFELRRRM